MSYLEKEFYNLLSQHLTIQQFVQQAGIEGIWMWDCENEQNIWLSLSLQKLLNVDLLSKEKKELAYLPFEKTAFLRQYLVNPISNLDITYENLPIISGIITFTNSNGIKENYYCQMLWLQQLNRLIGIVFNSNAPNILFNTNNEQHIAQNQSVYNSYFSEFTNKYESLLSACNLGGWEYNCNTQEAWCSKVYFEQLGIDSSKLPIWSKYTLYDCWEKYLHDDDKLNAQTVFENFVQNPTGTYEQVFRMRHTNGHWIWIWSRGRLVSFELHGQPCNMIIGTHLDITAKMELENQLRFSKEETLKDNALLKAIINSPQGIDIFALDVNYRYIAYSNSHKHHIQTVYNKEINLGVNALDSFTPEVRLRFHRFFDRALQGEYFLIQDTNDDPLNLYYYELKFSPIYNHENSITGLTVFINDITLLKKAELTIKLNEMRYTALFNGSNDAIFISDNKSGKIIDVNDAGCNLLECSKAAIIGQNQQDIFDSEKAIFVKEQFDIYNQTHILHPFESCVITRKGNSIPVNVMAGNPFNVDGKMYNAIYIQNITFQKNAETKVANTEELLKQAEKVANIGSFEVNYESNSFLWSDEFLRILGYEPGKITPHKELFEKHIHPDFLLLYKNWRDYATPLIGASKPIELKIIDNRRLEKILSVNSMGFANASGKLIKHVRVAKDITERKKLEAELFNSHQLLRKLTEQLPIAILQLEKSTGSSLKIPFISAGISKIFTELTADTIMQQPDLLLNKILADDLNAVKTLFKESSHLYNDFSFECRTYRENGEIFWVKFVFRPEKRSANTTVWYGYIEDITLQKKFLLQLEEQNMQLRDIAWTQSHIVRAPLSRLMGLLHLFEYGIIGKTDEQEMIQYMQEAANELDNIIREIVQKVNKLEVSMHLN